MFPPAEPNTSPPPFSLPLSLLSDRLFPLCLPLPPRPSSAVVAPQLSRLAFRVLLRLLLQPACLLRLRLLP